MNTFLKFAEIVNKMNENRKFWQENCKTGEEPTKTFIAKNINIWNKNSLILLKRRQDKEKIFIFKITEIKTCREKDN